MSRIGSQHITIPSGVEVQPAADGTVTVKGPKGELKRFFKPRITLTIGAEEITLEPKDNSSSTRALWGTYASHLLNMIKGVSEGFEKRLSVEGVGYRAEVQGQSLVLIVGLSHPVSVPIPPELTVSVEKAVISVFGIDKEQVGLFASRVRAVKPPEPYKGKGIRYEDETVRMKEGKKSA